MESNNRKTSVLIAEVLLVALLYWALAHLGHFAAIQPGNASPVWPASGLALAAVFLRGNRVCPGVWLGSFFYNGHIFFFEPERTAGPLVIVAVSAVIGIGATLQAYLGANWTLRYCGTLPLERLSSLFRFIALQVSACTVSATCGTLAVIAGRLAPLSDSGKAWGTWYLGDAVGVILLAPALLNLQEFKRLRKEPRQLGEGALILCLIIGVAYSIFSSAVAAHFMYLLVPLIIWSAVRGGALAVSFSVLGVAGTGVYYMAVGDFTFFSDNVHTSVLTMQGFAGILSLTGLSVSAAIAELRASDVELRQALSAAETSEAQFRTLVQFAPEAIVVLDVDAGRFVDANVNAESLFGLTRAQLLEKHPADVSPVMQPDGTASSDSARQRIDEALRRDSGLGKTLAPDSTAFDWVHQNAEGREIPCEVRLTRLPPKNRRLVRASIVDVSDRKRLESQLRQSIHDAEAATLHLRHALKAGNVGLWDWDMTTGQVFFSEQFKQQLGYGPEAQMSTYHDWESRLHPEDRESTRASIEDYVAQKSPRYEPVFRMRQQNGEYRWILSQGEIIRDPLGKPIRMLGAHIDVTERKKDQDALVEYSRELERRNAELDSFAYIASHDLKAPLRGIRQLAEWLQEDLAATLPEESKHQLEQISERVDRLDNLLADLLMYSRAGRVHGNQLPVNIRALIEQIVETIMVPAGFKVVIDADVPDIETLPTPLTQVLTNLITNAIKHHDQDCGTVTVAVEQDDDCVTFRVKDDGPGIPAQFHERVFEVFETLKPRDDSDSTGIGLAIVRKIVESYGGQVEIDSTAKRGTTVFFTWRKQIDPIN